MAVIAPPDTTRPRVVSSRLRKRPGQPRSAAPGPTIRWLRLPLYPLAATMLIPFYWMVITAFKPVSEIDRNPPSFVPLKPTFDAFYDSAIVGGAETPEHPAGLFQKFADVPLGFWRFMFNSALISTSITVLSLVVASLAAYVIVKHRVPGGRIIFVAILASMMVPWQIKLVPNYLLVRDLGWIDTYMGYIVPAIPRAFVVFFLVQYLRSIPDEIIEAARTDGAGEWRIWWRIVLPLLRPALAAMSIFVMLNEWNNFLWPLIIVQSDSMANLPVALSKLTSPYGDAQSAAVLMAAAVLTSVPTVALFLAFQKQFTRGIALSGLKA